MNYKLPRCKHYVWTEELKNNSDIGDCTNPNVKHFGCNLYNSQKRNCYEEGNGSWGPGNDKKIAEHEEILELNKMISQ